MKSMVKKQLLLSIVIALAAFGAVDARSKGKKKKKTSIVGSWNITLFGGVVGDEAKETKEEVLVTEANENEEEAQLQADEIPGGFFLQGVITFNDDHTVVADGIVPFFVDANSAEFNNFDGIETTIAVGTWRRAGKDAFIASLSAVVEGIEAATAENGLLSALRVKTTLVIRVVKDRPIAVVARVIPQVFAPNDICFEKPLPVGFPALRGRLCKIPCPRKIIINGPTKQAE